MTSRRSFYKKKTVLVVDDSDQIRSYLKSMLILIGFDDVMLARDAEMAASLCRRNSYDFVLCDFHLGRGRDGYQLFEVLRAERLLKSNCCFLVISAERQRASVYGMIEFQPDDYLLKPFSYAELERRIGRSFHLRQALHSVFQAIFQNDYASAVLACDDVITNKSKYALHASRLKAELLIKLERPAEAELIYQWALTIREFGWAQLGLAIALGYQGQQEAAEALLHELTGRAETKIEALDWLTRLYISQQKPIEALTAVEQVAKASPRNYLRQHVLATLAAIDNQTDLAVQVHYKLLSAAKYSMHDTADNMLNYARALVEQALTMPESEKIQQISKIDSFIQTIKKRFHPSSYEHDRAVVEARMLLLQGKKAKALQLLAQSEELSHDRPVSAMGMLDRARAYFESGNLAMCDHYITALSTVAQDDNLYCSALQLMMQHEQKKYQQLREQLMQQNAGGMQAFGGGDYALAIDYFYSALLSMPANINVALNLLQAIGMNARITPEQRVMANDCISLLNQAPLAPEQQKRFGLLQQQIQRLTGN